MIAQIDFEDGVYLKRCDLLNYMGAFGGKAEGAYNLIKKGIEDGYTEFVTVGSRFSPQCDIVSKICEGLNVKCVLFMPNGKRTEVITNIEKRSTSRLNLISMGAYTNVLIKKAKDYCKNNNSYYVPFGMLCAKNIDVISRQVINVPSNIKRIIVPVGSGTTMIGIIKGLNKYNRTDIEVIGIITGSNLCKKNIKNFISPLFNHVRYRLYNYKENIKPDELYKIHTNEYIGNIRLDPIYEGKCKKFIKPGDLLWIVGYHEI